MSGINKRSSKRSIANGLAPTQSLTIPVNNAIEKGQTALQDCEFPLQVHYLQNMVPQSCTLLVLKKGWKDKVTGRQCPLNDIPNYSSSLSMAANGKRLCLWCLLAPSGALIAIPTY